MKSSTLAAIILLGVSVNQARASDGSGPDYASQARSISTTSLQPALDFTASFDLVNIGDSTSPTALQVRYLLFPLSGPTIPVEPRWRNPLSGSLVGSNVRQIFPGPGASGDSVPVETILNAPPDTPSGSYRLIVTIDPDEARTDCDRSNNTFQIGGTLTVLPAPDLGFLSSTSINVSGTNVLLGAGGSFTINLSYRNAGGLINIPAFPIDYYLVPENRIYSGGFQYGAADVVFLGRRTAPGLTASQQVTSQFWATTSQAFSLPADLTLTNYRVGARLDPDNAVHEVGDEKNDQASGATENIGVLYIIERPDYTSGGSSFISFSTNSAPAGNFVTFSGRVLNTSPFTNPNITTIRHFLRRGNAGIPIPIGVSLMPPVAAIGFHDFSAALQIPADLYPDDYTYLFQIDDAEVVPERDETNNQGVFFGTELEVTPPVRPDIVAEGGQFTPQGIQPGGTLTIQADLENAGFSATGSFSARFFLSSDTTVGDADDITLGTRTIAPGLSAGASATFTPSLTIPANTPYGQYRVGWVLDSNGQVAELSEANNTLLLPSPMLTVSPGGGPLLPDLRPLSATPNPNRADFAEDLSLSVIVRNDGVASASGVVCAAWLSVDDIAGNADDFALGSVNLGTIGASAQKAGTLNGAMPKAPYPVGMCRLILEADPSGGIAESDETNNVAVTAPVLQLLPTDSDLHPLLQIGQQSVSPAVCLPGQSIETFALVRNVGGSSAGGVVTRLVLSLDGSLGNADDILLREFGPDTLPVSSGGTVFSASVSLPDTIAPGAYLIGWRVDPDRLIPLQNGSQTQASAPLVVRARRLHAALVKRQRDLHIVELRETDPKKKYIIRSGPDLLRWQESDPQTGNADRPLSFEIPVDEREAALMYFHQGAEVK